MEEPIKSGEGELCVAPKVRANTQKDWLMKYINWRQKGEWKQTILILFQDSDLGSIKTLMGHKMKGYKTPKTRLSWKRWDPEGSIHTLDSCLVHKHNSGFSIHSTMWHVPPPNLKTLWYIMALGVQKGGWIYIYMYHLWILNMSLQLFQTYHPGKWSIETEGKGDYVQWANSKMTYWGAC